MILIFYPSAKVYLFIILYNYLIDIMILNKTISEKLASAVTMIYACINIIFYRTIYEKLASAFTEDLQSLYMQQVAEVAPNIRYCAYNIGDESAISELKQMRRQGGLDQLTSHIDVSFTN